MQHRLRARSRWAMGCWAGVSALGMWLTAANGWAQGTAPAGEPAAGAKAGAADGAPKAGDKAGPKADTAPSPDASAEPKPAAPAMDPPDPEAKTDTAEPAADKATDKAADKDKAEAKPDEPTQPPHTGEDDRPVPDYDGRGDEPVDAGDVLIWVPRSILAPVYLVAEYVLRWPIGKLVSVLDVNDVPNILTDFFTFGPGDKSGLVPSALIDFGFRPSVGLYFFSDDLIAKDLGIRANAAYGGSSWYLGRLTVRYTIQEQTATQLDHTVELQGLFQHRPDWRFHGIGPDSLQDDGGRYTGQTIDGTFRYDGGLWRSSRLTAYAGVRDMIFKDGGCCEDPELVQQVARGRYALPSMFDDGYLIARAGFNGSFDTRERRNAYDGEGSDHVSPTGSGLKLAARADLGIGLREGPAFAGGPDQRPSFIRYGGTAGGFLDVYQQRVLGLEFALDFADPLLDGSAIPFTELVSLGGFRPLRGFLNQRLLGRSSFVGHFEYRWPVWVSLDGVAHYSVGNVFGRHLEGFKVEKLRQSFGFGLRAIGSRDHSFEILVAGGTATFEQGSSVDSFRFVFGSTTGL